MTLVSRLRTSTARIAHLATGTALGIGLAASLLISPDIAFAQAAPAPAPPAAGAPRAVVPAQGQGPALWVVRDADSTLYLFGTVHALRPETAWGSAKVDAAFDSAERVVLEISNPDDQAALAPVIETYGKSPNRQLSHLVTSGELTLLDAAARQIGLDAVRMDPLRPWLAALTLSIVPLLKAGYDPNSGVELILKARAEASGKPVSGFETIDKQVSILAGLSEETQLEFLRATLEEVEDATADLDALVVAWASGDVDSIERLGVDEMRSQSKEIYEALLVRRNADWAQQIETLLAGSGTVFIAVGSAHLAGDDSVQALLEQRGVSVSRE